MLYNDQESSYRVKILLVRYDGYTVPDMRRIKKIMVTTLENRYADSIKKSLMVYTHKKLRNTQRLNDIKKDCR